MSAATAGQPVPEVYRRWLRIDQPKNWAGPSDGLIDELWREKSAEQKEFWRSLDAAQEPQPAREDAGTITHIPTGATWVTWDKGRQPPWKLIAEAVSRLTGGTVKIRAGSDEDEPDRLYVAVYRDLPELEDE